MQRNRLIQFIHNAGEFVAPKELDRAHRAAAVVEGRVLQVLQVDGQVGGHVALNQLQPLQLLGRKALLAVLLVEPRVKPRLHLLLIVGGARRPRPWRGAPAR